MRSFLIAAFISPKTSIQFTLTKANILNEDILQDKKINLNKKGKLRMYFTYAVDSDRLGAQSLIS